MKKLIIMLSSATFLPIASILLTVACNNIEQTDNIEKLNNQEKEKNSSYYEIKKRQSRNRKNRNNWQY